MYRRVHFENSPAPCTSPDGVSRNIAQQLPAKAAAEHSPDQSKQVLPEMQNPLKSATTGTAFPPSPVIEEPNHEEEAEELNPLGGQALEENSLSNMLEVEERHSSENPRVYSETSSLSESAFLDTFVDKVSSELFSRFLMRGKVRWPNG